MASNASAAISGAELRKLKKAFASGEQPLMLAALGEVARGRNMLELHKTTGIARKALYDALSDTGNPRFSTLVAVLTSLGLRLDLAMLLEVDEEKENADAR